MTLQCGTLHSELGRLSAGHSVLRTVRVDPWRRCSLKLRSPERNWEAELGAYWNVPHPAGVSIVVEQDGALTLGELLKE